MKRIQFIFLMVFMVACSVNCFAGEKITVLLLSGQNNHDWQASTPVLKDILEKTGRFEITVDEHPEALTADKLKPFQVIVSNWNGYGKNVKITEWPEETRKAYADFVRNGGGHVVVHAGSSSFYDWPDYHKICLTRWEIGQTEHGPAHKFKVRIDDQAHPIVKGIQEFEHADELWNKSGVHPDAVTIASAYSAPDTKKGTGNWEPMLLVGKFGAGRTFTTLMGHAMKGNVDSLTGAQFQQTFVRGVEWAATGEVTL